MATQTVMMLGAGASRASEFSLPTMAGFFDESADAFPELVRFLEGFYPGHARARYNLEDVLAFLDMSRARLPLWGIHSQRDAWEMDALYQDLLHYVSIRLGIPDGATCGITRQLVSLLDERDTVISFNYDLLCDYALANAAAKDQNGG